MTNETTDEINETEAAVYQIEKESDQNECFNLI